jgi:hypothetical protein
VVYTAIEGQVGIVRSRGPWKAKGKQADQSSEDESTPARSEWKGRKRREEEALQKAQKRTSGPVEFSPIQSPAASVVRVMEDSRKDGGIGLH